MELNELETAVDALRTGHGTILQVLRELVRSPLAVPTTKDPATEQFSPVLTDVEGVPHMVVATRPALLTRTSELAHFAVSMTGRQIVQGVQPGNGLMVQIPQGAFQVTAQDLEHARAMLDV